MNMTNIIKRDTINPEYYKHGNIETIKIIDHIVIGYKDYPAAVHAIGDAIKYLDRAPFKGHMIEDLKKARWYISHAIKSIEGDGHD